MIAKILAWGIRKWNFSDKDRLVLITGVMHSLDAVPLHAIISVDENRRILVQGKPISSEQAFALSESAATALRSQALSLVHEQVKFAAIDRGFLKSDDPRTQLFYKAALWFAQQERELLEMLSPDLTR